MAHKRNMTNIEGQSFGRLMARHPVCEPGRKTYWVCSCECGVTLEVRLTNLLNGSMQSCGCARIKHNRVATTEYRIWQGIIARCCNPKHPHYKHYGGRGITIAAEWRHDFQSFLAAVGMRPSLGHTIDRIDNDGSYVPGNVRWATRFEQAANRRQASGRRRSTLEGEKISVRRMAEYLAISYFSLKHLLAAEAN